MKSICNHITWDNTQPYKIVDPGISAFNPATFYWSACTSQESICLLGNTVLELFRKCGIFLVFHFNISSYLMFQYLSINIVIVLYKVLHKDMYVTVALLIHRGYWHMCIIYTIRVITKLTNTEQSSKGKGKTHKSTNRQNHSTTGKLGKPQWPWLGTGISKEMVGWIRFYDWNPFSNDIVCL
jgi:hypothetical protein